jgi:putative transposase
MHSQVTKFKINFTIGWVGNSIQEVQNYATKWLWTYNNDRPNMGIGGITPAMKLNQYKLAA